MKSVEETVMTTQDETMKMIFEVPVQETPKITIPRT